MLTQQYFSAGLVWSLSWGSSLPLPILGRGVLFHYHFWGRGSSSIHHFWGGVLFHHHFWGGPLLPPLLGGPLPPPLLGGGSHVTYHNNALIYHYRTPQCIMGKIHMGPPLELNRLTNMCEDINFPHTTYAGGKYTIYKQASTSD